MTIRAVIFDWGGVLVRTECRAKREALAAELGLTPEALEDAVFGCAAWQAASRGARSADDAWAEIIAALGFRGPVLAFVRQFFGGDRLDWRLVALIGALRGRGLRVGLLSNAPGERAGDDDPVGRWGRAELFDAQVFSYQLGLLKPHPATYAAALRALGVAAHEALFVDDVPANVNGARQAGLHAVQFVGTDALLADLACHGLSVARVA